MPIFVKERGEIVCRKCGLIISDREFDIFQEKTKRWSPEAPISYLFTDIGLNTLINSKKIHNENLKRAIKRDSHLSWKQRNMVITVKELKRLFSKLRVPN